jgi:uncharacterized membrane protein SpoIIM required for sporulation/ABC-type transport system involved in multi-copper enzyme maturation permease subunit
MLGSLRMALVISRREVRDQFRDWRIIFPVVVLTLVFPMLMNFTARQAVQFVQKYNAPVVGDRLIPFLLMVVGFFPISVSLVIALESFVGEKERRSIEPLLCSPLTDGQLYLGKLLAAMVPPLLASYLGITVYLIAVAVQVGWRPEPVLLSQILLLTSIQAILMVSGAVVISSQTTSVRAANLLASFIIIPMAFLIQAESIIMFWAQYNVLWWIVIGEVLITGLLIRTGVAYFNREEMLGRELDSLNLYWGLQSFKSVFIGSARNPFEWYRVEVPKALRNMAVPALAMTIVLGFGAFAGVKLASVFVLPADRLNFNQLSQGFIQGLGALNFFSPQGVLTIFLHNLRAVVIAGFLGLFTFGVLGALVLALPIILIAYVAANLAAAGLSPLLFLEALVLPHGILEIPAIILSGAAILYLGATLATPAEGKTIGEAWLLALAKSTQVIVGVALPLFLGAALLEVFVTPYVAVLLLGK